MIQDKSENFEETWKFLERRFEDLQQFSLLTKSVEQTQQIIGSSFRVVSFKLN
jgi:ubiquinone biosynthesis protein COQ9